jgi:sterol desaturase/sphingolipid hydroxylase (fatty acid hydroxylase superfamily)
MTAKKNNARLRKRRGLLLLLLALWAIVFITSIILCLKNDSKIFDFTSMGVMIAAFAVGLVLERVAPAERQQPRPSLALNIGYSFLIQSYTILQGPLIAVGTIALLNHLGLGLITLSEKGWLLLPSAAAYLLAMDFMEYLFHRAQHRFPFLWAMHSFHHSDRAMNITTTFRHFWFERTLHAIAVSLPVALLFKAPPEVLLIYGLWSWNDYFTHMNLRLSLGPFWCVINGPQYHRLHHSLLPEHWNKNFADHFPIFDILFGTHHKPKPGEFPPTGLEEEVQIKFSDTLLWPLRPRRTP